MATPPLSLNSSPGQRHTETLATQTVSATIKQRSDIGSQSAAQSVQLAIEAANLYRQGIKVGPTASGVRIWSGPSADRQERSGSMMPSISESPLEQDFTVEGTPSKLGCPFASMAGKKLSSHAASVLSRYNPGTNATGSPASGQLEGSVRSSVSRVNGKESFARRASGERRTSFADPIKAEICGLDSHNPNLAQEEDHESPLSERAAFRAHVSQQEEVGVCPIRFLDQHSPEEVATYFEKHKHELPRSHEVCVKRYQSNEKQIRELDAKYGNLVSMIQGLGEKHQNYLPKEPDAEEAEGNDDLGEDDSKRDEKVRKWASSVSVQAGQDHPGEHEERTPHFERPLRDVRVGESPSRPWGISVPAKYLEEAAARSECSSSPVKIKTTGMEGKDASNAKKEDVQCPFGFDKADTSPLKAKATEPNVTTAQPVLIDDERKARIAAPEHEGINNPRDQSSKRMVFTGPVFIGYSAEDAAKILRESGLERPL